ncbi:type I glutamate--ammonia ligase [Planctomycetota bacterium]
MVPTEVVALIADRDVKFVDLRFMDFPGMWQQISIPARRLTVESFEDGFGFDGSSIRGWQAINESDMLVVPDPSTAFLDPFRGYPTLCLICDIRDPITRAEYGRDSRNVAKRAVRYLASTGIADTAYFGPEAEFFIFSEIAYENTINGAFYRVDSAEGCWNSGEPGSRGYKLRQKEGYFPVPPSDTLTDIRSEIVMTLEEIGIQAETHHHEVATGGQSEIGFRYLPLVECADALAKFKYVVKNVAYRHQMTATFMPKPLFGDNGNGMHTHLSLWKADQPLFAGDAYSGLSELALHAVGGILKHAPAVCAWTNPTTNSYKRLVPGFEAPVKLAYSHRNRSAAVRVPTYDPSPKARRCEFRCPDSSCNPYFAFSAMLMAAIDGIENKIDPGEALDKNIYDLPPEELEGVPSAPGSLDEALSALERDNDFLLRGDVFTEDLVRTWVNMNRAPPARIVPHEKHTRTQTSEVLGAMAGLYNRTNSLHRSCDLAGRGRRIRAIIEPRHGAEHFGRLGAGVLLMRYDACRRSAVHVDLQGHV